MTFHLVQVDVGKCSGVCSAEESAEGSGEEEGERTSVPLQCMATRTTTEAIEGPNGEDCMVHTYTYRGGDRSR